MIKRFLFLYIFCVLPLALFAQVSVDEILLLVEQNNTTLKAASDKTEAAKQEVMMETSLEDPEIGFDYLWGKPGMIGKRKDINVNQTFDLATVFGYRKRLAKSQKELLELELQQKQLETRLEAMDLLVQITYYNQALAIYEERLQQEKQLAASYEKRLAAGDANKLEANRARLSLVEIESETEKVKMERDLLMLQLQTLCGGTEIMYNNTDYNAINIASGMSLKALQEAQNSQQERVAENDLKTARAQSMPSITAGYMAELTDDEKWNGVTIGVSIPLWSNRHNMKRARLSLQSARSEAADASYKLEQFAASQRLRTERYHDIAQKMQQKLANASSTTLLRKALEEGEISLVEYTIESSDLFDLRVKTLEAERDFQQAKLLLSAL